VKLYPHQQRALNWMVARERSSVCACVRGGICADDMGMCVCVCVYTYILLIIINIEFFIFVCSSSRERFFTVLLFNNK